MNLKYKNDVYGKFNMHFIGALELEPETIKKAILSNTRRVTRFTVNMPHTRQFCCSLFIN